MAGKIRKSLRLAAILYAGGLLGSPALLGRDQSIISSFGMIMWVVALIGGPAALLDALEAYRDNIRKNGGRYRLFPFEREPTISGRTINKPVIIATYICTVLIFFGVTWLLLKIPGENYNDDSN